MRVKPTYVVELVLFCSLSQVTVGHVRCCDRYTRRSKQGRGLVVCEGGYITERHSALVDTLRGTVCEDSIAHDCLSLRTLYTILPSTALPVLGSSTSASYCRTAPQLPRTEP